MITPNPVFKRGRTVWDATILPRSEFEQRVRHMQQAMKDKHLDLLLAYGDAIDYGNLCWLSGYVPRESAIVVLPGQGEPILICNHGSRELNLSKSLTWIKDVRSAEFASSLAQLLKEITGSNISKDGSVGLVGLYENMPARIWTNINDQLAGFHVINMTKWLSEIRQVKSVQEICCMQSTASLLESVSDEIKGLDWAGMREYELASIMNYRARNLGAEDVRLLFASPGSHLPILRPPTEKYLRSGDWLQIYLAISKDRYWSDAGFCLPVEKDEALITDLNSRVEQLVSSLISRLRPGVTLETVATMLMDNEKMIQSSGSNPYGLGGGIGLSIDELPVINMGNSTVLVSGMTLSVNIFYQYNEIVGLFKTNLIVSDEVCKKLNSK